MKIPLINDMSDYLLVRKKTFTRIAIADIMDDKMLLKWYRKVLDNQSSLFSLKGFGYFESEHSHGYVMASRRFNKIALDVIRFQLELRKINIRNNRQLSILEDLSEGYFQS